MDRYSILSFLILGLSLFGCLTSSDELYGGCGQRYLEDGTLVSNEGYPTISAEILYENLLSVDGAKVQVFREGFDMPIETKYSEHGIALLDLHRIVDECVDVVISKEGYQTISKNVCVGHCSIDTSIDVILR